MNLVNQLNKKKEVMIIYDFIYLEWEMKKMELESTITNQTLQAKIYQQEKTNFEKTIAELKSANKDLKEKVKLANNEKASMNISQTGYEKETETYKNEIENLKKELAEKDRLLSENETQM